MKEAEGTRTSKTYLNADTLKEFSKLFEGVAKEFKEMPAEEPKVAASPENLA